MNVTARRSTTTPVAPRSIAEVSRSRSSGAVAMSSSPDTVISTPDVASCSSFSSNALQSSSMAPKIVSERLMVNATADGPLRLSAARAASTRSRTDRSMHGHDLHDHAVRHRQREALVLLEAESAVQRLAGERRAEDELGEALGRGVALAALQDRAAQAAARPVAAHEHRAHARGLAGRVEQPVVIVRVAAAGEELVAPAPAAARDDLALLLLHVVGA